MSGNTQMDPKKTELEAIMYAAAPDRPLPIFLAMPGDALISKKWLRKGELVICVDTVLARNSVEYFIATSTPIKFTPDQPGNHPRWATELQWGPSGGGCPVGLA